MRLPTLDTWWLQIIGREKSSDKTTSSTLKNRHGRAWTDCCDSCLQTVSYLWILSATGISRLFWWLALEVRSPWYLFSPRETRTCNPNSTSGTGPRGTVKDFERISRRADRPVGQWSRTWRPAPGIDANSSSYKENIRCNADILIGVEL